MVVLEWPNCLNGKSFLRGWGRGMTNFQLCGSGNWERMIPWWRVKRGDFAVSVTSLTSASSGTASLIFEVDQISLQLKCQICRARHSLQCISHCSTRLCFWHLTSWRVTCLTPFVPRHWSTSIPWARVGKQTFIPSRDHSSRSGAISKEFRANGTLNCAKKLNTNPVHRTQHSDRGQIIQTQGLN